MVEVGCTEHFLMWSFMVGQTPWPENNASTMLKLGRHRGLQRAGTFPLVSPRSADVPGTLQARVPLSEVL